MISTYIVAEFQPTDRHVEVTYFDKNDFVHKRLVNIPHLDDGSVDEVYFQSILEGQLNGVKNKIKLGMIEFRDPTAEPVGITTTS